MSARKVDFFSLTSGQAPLFHTARGTQPVNASP